jgi:hypothetical protein
MRKATLTAIRRSMAPIFSFGNGSSALRRLEALFLSRSPV